MPADIAGRERAEQRVHHRVGEDIRIRMPRESRPVRDIHAADDAPAPLFQPVYVVTVPDPHVQISSFCSNASATAISSGVVILMFS